MPLLSLLSDYSTDELLKELQDHRGMELQVEAISSSRMVVTLVVGYIDMPDYRIPERVGG